MAENSRINYWLIILFYFSIISGYSAGLISWEFGWFMLLICFIG